MAGRKLTLVIFSVAFGLILVACGGAQPAPANPVVEDVPVTIAATQIVSDGRLVPHKSVKLAFASGGQVAEILVQEGELVKAGDAIARLGDREPLEANIAAANLEYLAAQQELFAAQKALDDLNDNLPEAQTQALEAITNARQGLRDAERKLNGLTSPASQNDIDSASASVVLAKDRYDKARKDFEPYANKSEDNLVRATLLSKLTEARRNYEDAVRRLNNFQGVLSNSFDLSQAQAEFEIAQARLAQAEADYEILRAGPDPQDVRLAESRIATAEGRVESAKATLAAAEAALADLDLVATIDGLVIDNDLIAGQQVSPGVLVVTLADFSQWYVETDDLTEIEVVNVSPDNRVSIVPDALPELELSGQVESIGNFYEEKQGDVTYTARILVNEADPRLRWGMTVVVTFEE
jgi:HlyD family secretion protein